VNEKIVPYCFCNYFELADCTFSLLLEIWFPSVSLVHESVCRERFLFLVGGEKIEMAEGMEDLFGVVTTIYANT
jgi:hypothetical protein